MNPEEIYKQFIKKLKKLREKEILAITAEKIILFLCFLLIGIYIATLSESVFRFNIIERKIILIFLIFTIISLLIILTTKPLKIIFGIDKSLNNEILAKKVGFEFDEIRDRFLNAIQIYANKQTNKEGYSEELIDNYVKKIGIELLNKDFSVAVDFKPVLSKLKIFGIVFGIGILLFGFFYDIFGNSFARIIQPDKEFTISPNFSISLKPGDLDIIRGENIAINVLIEGEKPDKTSLYVKEEGNANFSEVELEKIKENQYVYKIKKIKKSFEYFAQGVDDILFQRNRVFTTKISTINVIYRPMVRKLKVKLDFPAYSRLGSRYLDDNNGDISALKGTTAHLEVFANKNVTEGDIQFDKGKKVKMSVRNTNLSGNFLVREDDKYKLIFKDNAGITNEDPIEYFVSSISDQYPTVEIIEPGKDVELEEGMKILILFRIKDDFGFSNLKLAYKKSSTDDKVSEYDVNEVGNKQFKYSELPVFKSNELTQTLFYEWDLSKQDMLPEDEMVYFIEIYDNDAVSGPKRGTSEVFRIRFPSLAEMYTAMDNLQNENIEEIEEVLEKNQTLKQKLDDISLEMKKNYDASWEKRRELKNIADEHSEIQKKLENMQTRLEELIDKIEKNDLVALETLQKYGELQELLNEVITPEFKKTMEEIQKLLEKQLNNPEMRELVDKMNITQSDLLKKIERTLNIMKQIRTEQKMDEIVKRAEDLLKRQKDVQERIENNSKSEDGKKLAEDEKNIKKSAEELKGVMEEVAEKMSGEENMPTKEINASIEMFDNRKIPEKMEKMSENLMDSQIKEAGKLGKNIEKDLTDLSETLKTVQKAMVEGNKEMIKNAMLKSASNLLNLSKKEEQLPQETMGLNKSSSQFQSIAEEQLEILSALSRTGLELMELSNRTFFVTPELGQALAQSAIQMQTSIKELEERDSQKSVSSQTNSMMALNIAVEEIRRALGSLAKSSSASGLEEYLKRLEEMAGKQDGINQNTSELPFGIKPSLSQQAEMLKLAKEQEALMKALEELIKEMGNRSQILGDLDQIKKDMEEVVKDLKNKNFEKRTVQIQERILSRLLDAQHSLYKRDDSKKRKSETAKEYRALSPPELLKEFGDEKSVIKENLIKAMNEGYSRDFINIIRKYFDALNEIYSNKKD